MYLLYAHLFCQTELEERLLTLCRDNTGDIQEFRYVLSQPGVDPNIYDQVLMQIAMCYASHPVRKFGLVKIKYMKNMHVINGNMVQRCLFENITYLMRYFRHKIYVAIMNC